MRRYGLIVGAVALLGVGFFLGSRRSSGPEVLVRETTPLPMLLRQVQALGDLHTARYAYENVYQHKTHLRPQGLLAAFPGADVIAKTTTGNSAWVAAAGTVEAGVDLTQARIDAGRIVLPRARMYEPQVHARVQQAKHGFLWRDENLALSAVDDVKERMAGAARQQGILADAEKNALEQVKRLVPASVTVVVGS